MYWFILVHTSTNGYILTDECVYLYIQVYTVTYKYIPVHTSSYQYIPACTRTYWFILVHIGTYWYIPVHTSTYLFWSGFKKNANGFRTQDLLHTIRMHYHCTARVQTPNAGYSTTEMFVYIHQMFMFLPLYLALDVRSTAQVLLRPRLWPWRLPPGSGSASHDSMPLSPTAGWVQLMSSRCRVQNAGNSESGSTSASASARGPLAAVTMCRACLSIETSRGGHMSISDSN